MREGVWRVMEVRTFALAPARGRTRVLRLIGADAVNRWQPCTLLEPFDRPRRVEAAQAPRVVTRARWMRTCAALIAASPPAGCPATIADAQVTLMPHQIDPVLAVLRGRASRLLLADAVGLGKTIQAALLVRELRARGGASRVLILVPSGLRDQWRQELSHRAGLRGDIIDAAALAARTRELPPDVNPWSLPGILIVSLDFIKQPSVLHGVSTIAWDLLIVDEAHNLAEGTGRLAAADRLARHSRHVVLLTATPHHGSDDAFASLCRIGQIGVLGDSGDAIAIFRRTRQTMGLARTRKVHVLRVTPTKQERRLHTLLARYADRVERECVERECIAEGCVVHGRVVHERVDTLSDSVRSHAATLAMSVLLKRASSSASSLERSLRRRLALLDGSAPTEPDVPRQPLLPFGDERDDDLADGEPSHVLGAPGLRSARVERAWLTLLIEAARNAARDESKPRALARLLRRCQEPALIYTEYRDTLTHLVRTLKDKSSSADASNPSDPSGASSHAMLHGGLGADARRAALARFTSGDARILLTTDAAGEGLNLHHRCRLVINVELPWNPNRLEQRIGRVDRLGQTQTVHAIHLVAAGTAEEQMLTRLTGRVARIAATLGDAPAVLRADLMHGGASPDEPGRDGSNGDSCRAVSAMAVNVTAQLQLLRALRTQAWRIGRRHAAGMHASRGDPLLALDERAPMVAVICRRWRRKDRRHSDLPGPGLLCVWRTRVHRDDGHSQGRARPPSSVLTVTHIACQVPSCRARRAVVAFVTSTLERGRGCIRPLLDHAVADARDCLDVAERARVERLARRDDAIALEMASMLRSRAAANGSFQPLLFEDVAREAAMKGVRDDCGSSLTRDEEGRLAACDSVDASGSARELVTPSLVMVLVLR